MSDLIQVRNLTHRYPATKRRPEPLVAVKDVSFSVGSGEMFCLLGPNGSGKSTLFRILSTMLIPSEGHVTIGGRDLVADRKPVRRMIGVVFQHPSLDDKLTVYENLLFQGHFQGLAGAALEERITLLLGRVGLEDRRNDSVEHLSGGNQRRVELAKALLHQPSLLILDEPSTGLDPVARKEFTLYLRQLSQETGLTVLLTTHILDEAELFDRIGIMDRGSLVTTGTPSTLKGEIGGEVIAVQCAAPDELRALLQSKFGSAASVVNGTVRIERPDGHSFIPQIVEAYRGKIDAITLSQPTLEDVFIHHTGHTFLSGEAEA